MTFAEKIKELRKQKGLSQEQVSQKMEIAISSIRNYENGRLPDTHQLKIIKNFYNVSYEYLLDDSITNKLDDDIKIEKELGLSSLSISKIKNWKKYQLSNDLNLFLEKTNIEDLIYHIHEIQILENQLVNNISFLLQLHDFSNFFEQNLKNTNNKEIANLFGIFNTKMSHFYQFMDSTEIDFINITQCEDFRQSLRSVQDTFISGNANKFNVSLIEYTNICTNISKKMQERINFNKFEIGLIINDFFNVVYPNTVDYESLHYQDLKDYYKYKNQGLYIPTIAEKDKEKNKTSYKIGDEKNGGTRTNKKYKI